MKFRSILSLLSILVFFQASLVLEAPSLTVVKDRLSTFHKSGKDVVVPFDGDTYKAPSKTIRTKTGKFSFFYDARKNFVPAVQGNLDFSFVTYSSLLSSSVAWPLGARSPPVA